MDVDQDDKIDIVTGSYTGKSAVAWAKNLGNGKVAEPTLFKDTRGNPVSVKDTVIFYPFVCDWDNDGDMDLIGGGLDKKLYLIKNISGKVNGFDTKSELIKAEGKEITGNLHLVPNFIDWDKDGKKDLVCSFDCKVLLYKNIGTKEEPKFGKAEVLLKQPKPKPDGSIPTVNFKVRVVDYNSDGCWDLLIGGQSTGAGFQRGLWIFLGKKTSEVK